MNETNHATLEMALLRLAQLQRLPLDRLALQAAVTAAQQASDQPRQQLAVFAAQLRLKAPRWSARPDAAALPMLIYHVDLGWRVLSSLNGKGEWLADEWDAGQGRWCEQVVALDGALQCASLSLRVPYQASQSPVGRLILDALLQHRMTLVEAAIGGFVLSLISLVTSLYSMQVYDRVIPTAAFQTLTVLTLGMALAMGFELVAKRLRSNLYDRLIDDVDRQLARTVYLRFLAVRLDQLPASVGSLAGQLRGYETVRAFLVQLSTQFLIDLPFAAIFIVVMALLAGPLALIPLLFLLLSIGLGFWHKGRALELTRRNQVLANQKTGLLVETIEGAEMIKSGQSGWRMLRRWLDSSNQAREVELETRHLSEHALHLAALFQQVAYVAIVALGADMVIRGELSFGALIACSILSGRVLGSVAQVAGQLVQWGHAKAALQGLDVIWALEGDHHGVATPLVVDSFEGRYQIEAVRYSQQGKQLLELPALRIARGEKIAILGPVGAGKTTLLRLLSGMYKAQQGRILLDDIDIQHLARPWLAEYIGYLPQDGRLFTGTLRENLLLGLVDPGDSAILDAARQTGLFASVIAPHPLGLAQPIPEGGGGYSGGQRQLVNLTRLFLRKPRISLLDEPTAALDRSTELAIIAALRNNLAASDTLVLVTHKPELLALVERIIVVVNGRIAMDGPRDAVLQRLNAPSKEIVQ